MWNGGLKPPAFKAVSQGQPAGDFCEPDSGLCQLLHPGRKKED